MLTFRPHHFLCTVAFRGRGYSPSFVQNFQQICDVLADHPDTPIRVVSGADAICGACPHLTGGGGCDSHHTTSRLDANHRMVLGIQTGDVLTFRAGVDRLKQRMTLDAFHRACALCSWKQLGVCEGALTALRREEVEAGDKTIDEQEGQ